MIQIESKQAVQRQFGRTANSYVNSEIHAKSADLGMLVEMAEVSGKENMLDVATGGGHTANAFSPLVRKVTAFDLTAEMLKAAERFMNENGRKNVEFVQGDAENMAFANEVFDLVTCRVAPHHFPHVEDFISEVHRVLTPGGQFLLDDNVAPEDDAFDEFYNTIEKKRDYSHHRALKKTEWLRLLELAGFEIEETRRFTKIFEFDDWCGRMRLPEQEKSELNDLILAASDPIHRKFRVKTDGRQVESFIAESVLINAKKALY